MRIALLALTLLMMMLVVACGGSTDRAASEPELEPEQESVTETRQPRVARAELMAKSGSELQGEAVFTEADGVVTMAIRVAGVAPGEHAVHLHEVGDCGSDDGKSAGGHWNPTSADHGKWGETPYHRGDIGNLAVGEDGTAALTFSAEEWSIGGDPGTDVVGRAVIVHASPDDFTTQPTGAAGARIGCGVITLADAS